MENINFEALWLKLLEVVEKQNEILTELKTKGEELTKVESLRRERIDDGFKALEEIYDKYEAKAGKHIRQAADNLANMGKYITEKVDAMPTPEKILLDELKALLLKPKKVRIWRFEFRQTTVVIFSLSLALAVFVIMFFWLLNNYLDIRQMCDAALKYINELQPIEK